MQMLVDSKDFNRLAVNDDTMDPLCEDDFNFTQTKVDYENHSPLHDDDTDPFNETGEGVETRDDGEDGGDLRFHLDVWIGLFFSECGGAQLRRWEYAHDAEVRHARL